MTTFKIIGIILVVLFVVGFVVLQFGNVAKMINKTRDARATDKNSEEDKDKK